MGQRPSQRKLGKEIRPGSKGWNSTSPFLIEGQRVPLDGKFMEAFLEKP